MNAKKLERWLLLEQTGELSARRQKVLNACPESQKMREDIDQIFGAVRAVDAEPSQWAAVRINARLQKERRSAFPSIRVWQPILALAACLTLVVTNLDFTPDSSPSSVAAVAVGEVDVWNVQYEEDLAELEGLILAISDAPLDIMEM